ncbi:hypothetical protein BYT27DRAFT_7249274 [Phlegmacium glaucopus]|nr:hypothetical protein BYT27DRAFT_7249274 [Phlegmacium glaucopus]
MLYLFHRRLHYREGGEAITKSVVDSSVVYPNSEVKDEVPSFTDMLRVPPQVNQASQKEDKENEGKGEEKGEVKTVKGKRGVNDSDKKSFDMQDSGPWSSPSFKTSRPVPASNSTTNNYGDDNGRTNKTR